MAIYWLCTHLSWFIWEIWEILMQMPEFKISETFKMSQQVIWQKWKPMFECLPGDHFNFKAFSKQTIKRVLYCMKHKQKIHENLRKERAFLEGFTRYNSQNWLCKMNGSKWSPSLYFFLLAVHKEDLGFFFYLQKGLSNKNFEYIYKINMNTQICS